MVILPTEQIMYKLQLSKPKPESFTTSAVVAMCYSIDWLTKLYMLHSSTYKVHSIWWLSQCNFYHFKATTTNCDPQLLTLLCHIHTHWFQNLSIYNSHALQTTTNSCYQLSAPQFGIIYMIYLVYSIRCSMHRRPKLLCWWKLDIDILWATNALFRCAMSSQSLIIIWLGILF